MDVSVQSAIIAAGAVILGIVFDKILLSRLSEKQKEKSNSFKMYRAYANPLLNSGQALFWRLYEILHCKGRDEFLHSSSPQTEFVLYKKTSSYYRLGALLAWIQAYSKELSYLPVQNSRKLRRLQKSIDSIRDSLASGLYIEEQRVQNIAFLYNLDLPSNENELEDIHTRVERELRSALHLNSCVSSSCLGREAKLQLALSIITIIDGRQLSDSRVMEVEKMLDETIQAISIREAWIYRDYQSSIGDMLLKESLHPNRRYDVMGYGEFEELLNQAQENSIKWMSRLVEVFEDVKVGCSDSGDARISQLRSLLRATAEMLEILIDIDSTGKAILTEPTIAALKKICPKKKRHKFSHRNKKVSQVDHG